MMAVPISTEPDLQIGEPSVLWERRYFTQELLGTAYDVAPDGRFLMVKTGGLTNGGARPSQINVVLNWREELKQLIPAQ